MAEPERMGAFIPHPRPDHARVLLTCPCGTENDLTFLHALPPETQACRECGTELAVPEGGDDG